MDFKTLPNGNLEISCTNDSDKEELRDMLAKTQNDVTLLADLLEFTGWQGNSQLLQIYPENVGALTDAPMLSDDVTYDDDGKIQVLGKVYWYPNYMVTNFMEELLTDGRTVFSLAEPVD